MRKEILIIIIFILIILIQTVNAQQVIQLRWVEDSGNVQYDELGPYTKINYSDKIAFWCVKSSTWVTKCFEDIMVYAGKQYSCAIQLSLDGVNWFDEKIGMRFKCARADTGNTYTCFYAYSHDKGYVISQPIYYSDIDGEDDPDVLVYKGKHISVDILDKDGNVYYNNVPSGFTLKMLPKNIFPIRIKVNLQKSAYRQKLNYIYIIQNKFYGYVKDDSGKPIQGATVSLIAQDDPNEVYQTTTDVYGYFELYNLPSKPFDVYVVKDDLLLYKDVVTPPAYREYSTEYKIISIKGYVYDIEGNSISSATVKVIQDGKEISTTTNADGYYEFSQGLVYGSPIIIQVTKEGYESDSWTFTPPEPYVMYVINFTLMPEDISQKYTVYGIVRDNWTGEPLSNVKITIYNDTWSNTIYTNQFGFYGFKNISYGFYTLKVEKNGYETIETTVTLQNTTRIDLYLKPLYKLTIKANVNGIPISKFTAQVQNLETEEIQEYNTTNGVITVALPSGLYQITIISEKGNGAVVILLTENKTVNVNCSSPANPPQQIIYPPMHAIVLQIIKNGQPYIGIPVSIKNTLTNNTTVLITDSEGKITFWANSTILYEININNGEKIIKLYPSSTSYIVHITYVQGINIKFDTYMERDNIIVSYKDYEQKTRRLCVRIYNQTGALVYTDNVTTANDYALALPKPDSSTYYTVVLNVTRDNRTFTLSRVVGNCTGLLRDILPLLPGKEVTGYNKDFFMTLLSFGGLICLAGLFSKRNSRTGALAFAIGAGLVWIFGWLPVSSAVIALIVVMAILGKLEEGYKK